MKHSARVARLGAGILVAAASFVGLGGAIVSHAAAPSGAATFAALPGSNFEDIFPIISATSVNVTSLNTIRLLYLPLYKFTSSSVAGSFDRQLSLAQAPKFANGGKTVDITLKHYKWSDGKPVTARDAQLWENLLVANKASWAEYVPGQYPDDVTSFTVTGQYTFSLTFNQALNHAWVLRNVLAWITPLPQHLWDKTSATGAIGNYDQTPAGSKAVFTFLSGQAADRSTYVTNPLWKVVDGPFRLSKYDATTNYTVLVPNSAYSGSVRPKIARFEELTYTSAASEFDALRSGVVDYGYLPATDLSQMGYLRSHGFRVAPWYAEEINFVVLNYANTSVGPIFRQLYVRKALQEFINERGYVKDFYGGIGKPTYGPVPSYPSSKYVSSGERHPHYTYSPSNAATILRSHGWRRSGGGLYSCESPGSGSTECGTGIAKGRTLSFHLLYTSGSASGTSEVAALQSELSRSGIGLTIKSLPFDSIFSDMAPGSSSWQMGYWGDANSAWNFLQDYPIPSQTLSSGGDFNLGEYKSTTFNSDAQAALSTNGTKALKKLENYASSQIPDLWMPILPYQISVIKKTLKGALPQATSEMVQPQTWSLK